MNDRYEPITVPGRANLASSLLGKPGEPFCPPPPMSAVEAAVECLNTNQQRIDGLLGDLTNRLRMVIDHNEKDRPNLGAKECQTASCPLEARIINIQIGQCQTIERIHDLMGRLAL